MNLLAVKVEGLKNKSAAASATTAKLCTSACGPGSSLNHSHSLIDSNFAAL